MKNGVNHLDKLDKRVRQTRAALLDALLELMRERGYERLTVQNLLDRANVGRATFYAHFDSKDELLASSVARLRDWLAGQWRTVPGQRLGFTLPLFRHLSAHKSIYRKTIAREGELSVERHIRLMLHELVREELRARPLRPGQGGGAPVDLASRYLVGALWSTIDWWMENGAVLPPEEVNTLFQRLTFPGIDATPAERLSGGSPQ